MIRISTMAYIAVLVACFTGSCVALALGSDTWLLLTMLYAVIATTAVIILDVLDDSARDKEARP